MIFRLASVVFALFFLGAGLARADISDLRRYLDRGHALAKAGKPEQALPYLLLALEMGEKQFPPDDVAIVPLLDSLAEVQTAQGSFEDAELLLKRSLTIQERALDRNKLGIARTLSSLGFVYEATGRAEEAGKLYNRVLAIWQPKLGADDPSVLAAREGLAKLSLGTASGEDGYRIHLTSIRSPDGAKREWARLREEYPDLLAGLDLAVTRADLGPSRGVFYRIQGGVLSKSAAQARCLSFAKRSVWCQVVRAPPGAQAAKEPAEAVVASLVDSKPKDATATAQNGFRIHLTSIRNPKLAEQEWGRLRRLYPKQLGGLRLTVEHADLGRERGVYYRIEGGPLSRSAAQSLCGEFAARRIWCGVVRPINGAAEWPQGQMVSRLQSSDSRRYA
jgi:tetratricopeptide (TPR) repeat protein